MHMQKKTESKYKKRIKRQIVKKNDAEKATLIKM